MKDKSETYIVDDFQYDLKKMIEKIKEAEKEMSYTYKDNTDEVLSAP